MPSTVASSLTVNSDGLSSVNAVSKRTRQRPSAAISVNLAPGVTSRRSQRTLIARKDASITPTDARRRMEGCRVVLSDILSPGSKSQHLTDGVKVIQIQNVTTEEHSMQKNLTSTEPNSNVTRRTNPRRTKSFRSHESLVENQSTTTVVSENAQSIIHLDESSIGTENVAEKLNSSPKQTISSDDVTVQASEDAVVPKPRRATRRSLLRAPDAHSNAIDLRKAPKRKPANDIPPQDTGVSPPKQTPGKQRAVLEHSAEAACSTTSIAVSEEEIQPGTDKQSINTATTIIHLDQSSVGMKSVTEIADLSHTTGSDVIVQMPPEGASARTRRVTRRMSMKATGCIDNTIQSRKTVTRKSANDTATKRTVETANKQPSVLQQPAGSAASSKTSPSDAENTLPTSSNTEPLTSNRSLDKVNNNAFKILIVSIKRLASALTEAELKLLKYEDSTQDARDSLRPSNRIRWRPTHGSIKVERDTLERSTMAKPKIIVTSPIIEVPETSPVAERKPMAHSYLNVSKPSSAPLDRFKKPHPPTMPQLIEHEDEENGDVYEFLSSSQSENDPNWNETTQKSKRKKPQKAAVSSVKNKRKVGTGPKPKVKPPKQANPFGCNKTSLLKVIRKLGGGPVKQPDTVDYKINMEISKTPTLDPAAVVEPPQLDSTNYPDNDTVASVESAHVSHSAMERLTTRPPSFPVTSTPANRLDMVSNLNVTSQQKPASPWRVQEENILLRTSYTYRTKEMIPSYESFTTENNNNVPARTSAFVTERRKSPQTGTGSEVPQPLDASASTLPEQPGEWIVSDKDLREIEQMYAQLKTTSEMSQKLIAAMRTSKKNPTTPQQDQTMRLACLKLKKWYDRSMNAFNRSMRIVSNMQRTIERSTSASPVGCPSPLTLEQQRTLNNFNLSTDRFRTMIDQLQSAINDSDVENRPPASSPLKEGDGGLQKGGKGPMVLLSGVTTSNTPKDVVILPERGGKRNPLMPLNVVPLPQRNSPLMSPLAQHSTTGASNIRRELHYNKVSDSINVADKQQQKSNDNVRQTIPGLPEPSLDSVVEIHDQTTHDDCDYSDDNNAHPSAQECSTEGIQNKQHYFGFDECDGVEERSSAQVTLPMPLDISHETLQRRLQDVKHLLPKRPIFRTQPKQPNRSSGPTRFPATKVRVIGSPSKRPHTLRDFVASTPRPAGAASTVPSKAFNTFDLEIPDVSTIEPITEPATVVQEEHGAESNNTTVALFDTPDRPEWLNNSAHQRTYTRIPRRKKKNIYLANLGLDDESEIDEDVADEGPQELSSDSDTDGAKRKKNAYKRKARRKQPVRVEQTKDFKQFVKDFNSMCEEVERYELIIE